jgi:hypothetical protein
MTLYEQARCEDCPVNLEVESRRLCTLTEAWIDDVGGIPDWCPLHRGPIQLQLLMSPAEAADEEFAREVLRGEGMRQEQRRIGRILREAVNSLCSCGGCGPGDPKACDACLIWHRIDGFHLEYGESVP